MYENLKTTLLEAPIKLAQIAAPVPEAGAELPLPNLTPNAAGMPVSGEAGLAADNAHSVFSLFMRADFVVQSVMIMLLLASVWCWAIIIEKSIKMKKVRVLARQFEAVFWSGEAMEDIYQRLKGKPPLCPMSAIFLSAMQEWNRTISKGTGVLSMASSERIERGMQTTLNQELNKLEKYLTFLASVGSAAPFIGLFGTVWGIMNSFASIAASKQTSLAVVAPGISEALLATALGLVAAIPASIFYNKISSDLNRYAARLEAFSNEMAAIFSRQLDEQA
ncbi:MAG: protein TolQ [Alphaproteobacteria bacterium]